MVVVVSIIIIIITDKFDCFIVWSTEMCRIICAVSLSVKKKLSRHIKKRYPICGYIYGNPLMWPKT